MLNNDWLLILILLFYPTVVALESLGSYQVIEKHSTLKIQCYLSISSHKLRIYFIINLYIIVQHKMKWIIFGVTLIIWNYIVLGQDIVFPDDEELSHVSGNNAVITERIPVAVPGQCPVNMLLYPGYGNTSAWVCDCRPRFLYFPLNDSCYEAYRQGPCLPQNYVILPKNEAVPKCASNPCSEDGLVLYNKTCYPLRTLGGPCAPDGVLGVNETTFELECIPTDVAPFIIIQVPKRPQCPAGSRRNALGMCREIL